MPVNLNCLKGMQGFDYICEMSHENIWYSNDKISEVHHQTFKQDRSSETVVPL